ncbi:LOW QUALITY PROTEIN: protein ERGIC-53-like [Rhynchonycteris naso]
MSLNSGFTLRDPDLVCTDMGSLLLAPGRFFGVSTATRTLASEGLLGKAWRLNHGITKLFPGWVNLEGLRARLALGTRADMVPKLSPEDQEESRAFPQGAMPHGMPSLRGDLRDELSQVFTPTGDAPTHMASRAQVCYLPVGIKNHFLKLAQSFSLLQKDLWGPIKDTAKDPYLPGQPPGASSCLPTIFLFCLLIQTVGFFFNMLFRQELDKSLQDGLPTGSLPRPAPCILRALGVLRRQPSSPSMPAWPASEP